MLHTTALEAPVRTHRMDKHGSFAGFASVLYCASMMNVQTKVPN